MRILPSVRSIFRIAELRRRMGWTLALLAAFRIGSHIPLPGVNPEAVRGFVERASASMGGVWGFLEIFSGGAIGKLALFSLGIMPYITASIIVQLMTKVSATLEAISKEGAAGRRKIQQYTRYLTVPIALLESCLTVRSLSAASGREAAATGAPLLVSPSFWILLLLILAIAAGSLFAVWLGEEISERGLGNGPSVLITAGILARLPLFVGDMIRRSAHGDLRVDSILLLLAMFLATIAATVFVTQAQRRIPLQHARHIRGRRMMEGGRNYLPLRVNTSGVMPVIFASSLLVAPQILALLPGLGWMRDLLEFPSLGHALFHIAAVVFFSYFWTYLFFSPHEISIQLKENGSFVPGIRPGENTAAYLDGILSRITLCGAAFLCAVSLLPGHLARGMGLDRFETTFLGGTSILIVAGVGLDLFQKVESYLLMHHYEGFLGGERKS